MNLLKQIFKQDQNITKYKVGQRVASNKKADKIVKEAIRDIQNKKRRWL